MSWPTESAGRAHAPTTGTKCVWSTAGSTTSMNRDAPKSRSHGRYRPSGPERLGQRKHLIRPGCSTRTWGIRLGGPGVGLRLMARAEGATTTGHRIPRQRPPRRRDLGASGRAEAKGRTAALLSAHPRIARLATGPSRVWLSPPDPSRNWLERMCRTRLERPDLAPDELRGLDALRPAVTLHYFSAIQNDFQMVESPAEPRARPSGPWCCSAPPPGWSLPLRRP